ncbi:mitogen-activated protein kinase kinase kinase 3-like [Actinia tenebrosa]|uniref:Mitogen-activated protein kinase kinase kinase 3-like n=1 Tax=Actinia tenebrosa TaxID=6105 RepID=A0A6P8ILB6_ACTTE|nr:mitogen-activated protein kinase kinase kinase 3-like [Actinia tenebrosa]
MNEFRVLLLDIAQHLRKDDLEHLKFACSTFIPAGRAEFISRPHELFLELEKMGKLSESDREFLAVILVKIGRNDLRNKLLGIPERPLYEERPHTQATARRQHQLEPFKQRVSTDIILEIAEKTSTSWKFLGRHLKVPEHTLSNIDDTYKKTEEKGYAMLKKWSETSATPTVLVLLRALDKCGRRDLAEIIEEKFGPNVNVPGQRQFPNMRDLEDNLPDIADAGYPIAQHGDTARQGQQNRQPTEREYPETQNAVSSVARPIQVTDLDDLKKSGKDEYKICDLGKGVFSKVYLGMNRGSRTYFAVKEVDLGVNDDKTKEKAEALEKEINVLKVLDNPYIVKYFKTELYDNSLNIFMEYMSGGSIEKKLKEVKHFEQEIVRKYTWQLLKGLEYLHENNVIHRDIKGRNILLNETLECVKLCDFGISLYMEGIATSTGNCMSNQYGVFASVFWTSPELLCSEPYSYNTDIWSLGCVIVEMLTGDPPYRRPNVVLVQVMYKISTCCVEVPEEFSSMAKEFLDRCFQKSSRRPSAKDLLESEFPYPQGQ